ncbi:hypothetical protein AAFF_G00429820 [Aldrovandia affinis]|uniref:Uncharacterized protein n=1 Tax=Aldrovandia affinis TaxID=143900 RepID=A0AAD7S948_9TELE|nr:hypothetical protein AAFF_G00429820 [Aldrovandia affinis]
MSLAACVCCSRALLSHTIPALAPQRLPCSSTSNGRRKPPARRFTRQFARASPVTYAHVGLGYPSYPLHTTRRIRLLRCTGYTRGNSEPQGQVPVLVETQPRSPLGKPGLYKMGQGMWEVSPVQQIT